MECLESAGVTFQNGYHSAPLIYFCCLLSECKGLVRVSRSMTSEEEEFHFKLEDVLIFATGASDVPPIGFVPTPSIMFHDHPGSFFPMANTCTNTLKLPLNTSTSDYDFFRYNFVYGIANTAGYGQV